MNNAHFSSPDPSQPEKTSFLGIDARQDDKAKWVRAANAAQLTLEEWVTRELNQASAGERPKQ